MATNLKEKITGIDKPLLLIKTINEYIFKEEGFSGNQIDYMDPDNSYLNMVIERRTGIPISLSAIYLLITQRLDLPFKGVNLPGHFILKYNKQSFEMYIDPYYSGQLLTKRDCVNFMLFTGFGFKEEYLRICSNKEILLRMARNLFRIYNKTEPERANYLQIIMKVISESY